MRSAIGKVKGGGWALKDLGSEYGTWVNGERVQGVRLKPDDLILVGSRAYGPLRTTLLGSTSHHLLATAACSVLAMPRGMVSDPFAAAAD